MRCSSLFDVFLVASRYLHHCVCRLEQRLQGQIDKSLPSVDVFSRSKCIVLLLCAFILGLVVAVYSMCLGRAILQAKRKEGGAKAMTMR